MDPSLNGLEADVFWLPEAFPGVLRAYVGRKARSGWSAAVSLKDLQCRKAILDPVRGEQSLLLRSRGRLVQLQCDGDSIAIDPLAVSLVIGGISAIEGGNRSLRSLAELYRHGGRDHPSVDWTPQSLGLRNALIALDAASHGASHREIAEVIFGPRCVARDWSGGHGWMKSRIVRALRKGRQLVEGGYRDLLK